MTKEEIDILWNKALRESIDDGSLYTRYRFAELVAAAERNRTWTQDHWTEYESSIAAAEREACAKVCESMRPTEREFDQRFYTACTLNANAIRARGEK